MPLALLEPAPQRSTWANTDAFPSDSLPSQGREVKVNKAGWPIYMASTGTARRMMTSLSLERQKVKRLSVAAFLSSDACSMKDGLCEMIHASCIMTHDSWCMSHKSGFSMHEWAFCMLSELKVPRMPTEPVTLENGRPSDDKF